MEPLTFGRFQIPLERLLIVGFFFAAMLSGRFSTNRPQPALLSTAMAGLALIVLASMVTYFVTRVGARETITAAMVPLALFILGVGLTRSHKQMCDMIWAAVISLLISALTIWLWTKIGAAYPLYHESKGFLAYVINVGSMDMSIWANWTAAFGVLLTVLSLFTTIHDASRIRRGISAGAYLAGVYIAFQSGAKSGPIGVLLFTVLCILAFAKEAFSRHSAKIFFCAITLFSFGLYRGIQTGTVVELLNIETHMQRFVDFGQNYGSLQYRLDAVAYSWTQGRMGITGIGFGRAWTLDSIDESMYLLWLGNGAGVGAIMGHLIFLIALSWFFIRSAFSPEREKKVAARCGLILLLVIESMSFSSDQFLGEAVTGHCLFYLMGGFAGLHLLGRSTSPGAKTGSGHHIFQKSTCGRP